MRKNNRQLRPLSSTLAARWNVLGNPQVVKRAQGLPRTQPSWRNGAYRSTTYPKTAWTRWRVRVFPLMWWLLHFQLVSVARWLNFLAFLLGWAMCFIPLATCIEAALCCRPPFSYWLKLQVFHVRFAVHFLCAASWPVARCMFATQCR